MLLFLILFLFLGGERRWFWVVSRKGRRVVFVAVVTIGEIGIRYGYTLGEIYSGDQKP